MEIGDETPSESALECMAEVFGIKKPERALTESRKRILSNRSSEDASPVSAHTAQALYAPPPGWPSLGKGERGERADAGAWYQLKKIVDGWLVTLEERRVAGDLGAPPLPGDDLTVQLITEVQARAEGLRLNVLGRIEELSACLEPDHQLQEALQRYRDILAPT